MSKVILVIAAHPDDEAMGCGGTLARHAEQGDDVNILFLADGESSRPDNHNIERRCEAAENAASALGCNSPLLLGLADNQLDTMPLLEIVQKVEKTIKEISPSIIYTHYGGDLNIDHQITHQATLTAMRPQPDCKVNAIYGFETLSSTEWSSPDQYAGFRPTHFVDVHNYMDKKVAALKCYEQEMRPFPHARSFEAVKALANYRGVSVGVPAAEAFSVIREIVR